MRFAHSSTFATVLALAIAFAVANPDLAAAGCRNSNRLVGGATIGSQVDGEVVTICLSKSQLRKLKSTAKPIPRPTLKPKPQPTKAAPKPTPKPTPKLTATPARKQPPHIKPIPVAKPRVKTKTLRTSNGSNGSFRPSVAAPLVAPALVRPNQSVKLSSSQKVQFGRTRLLGLPVLVRMTPTQLDWTFGDGDQHQVGGAMATDSHSYSKAGSYLAVLHVTYLVEYRLKSGKWFRDPDAIILAAPPARVTVRDGQTAAAGSNVVLVTP